MTFANVARAALPIWLLSTSLLAAELSSTPEPPGDAVQWWLLAGAGHHRLDNGQPAWNEQFTEISRERPGAATYRFGIARDARFDAADLALSMGGDRNFASGWLVGGSLIVAGDADFRADLDYGANIGRTLQAGWVVGLRLRRREYDSTAVNMATGTLEKYVDAFRFAYALGVSQLPDSSALPNHAVTVNWYYNERSSIGLSLHSGKEAEAIGPGQVLETDVRGVSFSGRRQLNDRYGLQWWFGLHEQGNYYRRDYFGLAVSIKL